MRNLGTATGGKDAAGLSRGWTSPTRVDQIRATVGAIVGLLITGFVSKFALGSVSDLPLLIAPMGASAVLLFAVPGSPLAHPWSIIGGNSLSAFVGVACATCIPDPIVASALACGIAIGLMMAAGCLHPPGGAVALTAVLGGPSIQATGFGFALWPVGINSLLLLAAALAFNWLLQANISRPVQSSQA